MARIAGFASRPRPFLVSLCLLLFAALVMAPLELDAAANTPSVTDATTAEDTLTSSGLVISRNPADGAEVAYFKITSITNGTLYQNNGTTVITNNTFITFAVANAGLKFRGTTNYFGSGSFLVQASTTNSNAGLGGSTVTATITVSAVADTPSVTAAATISEDMQTTNGLVIARNTNDSVEVTHFKITSITNGTLFQNNGTTVITNGTFLTFAEGNAGLKFTPPTNFFGTGSFVVQASTNNVDAGLGGSTVTATITVTSVADTPSVTDAATTEDTLTSSGLVISRNAADGAEVAYFQITGLTNGTLYRNDGVTQIADNSFITFAVANAGLKFRPWFNSTANGGFSVRASKTAASTGLGGGIVTATITVTAVEDPPVANDDRIALDFDGVDDFVQVSNSSILRMTNAVTIEAWVRWETIPVSQNMIINKEGEYEVGIFPDGSVQWAFANTVPGWNWHSTGYVVPPKTWVHIAVTYSLGPGTNSTVTTYVNGAPVEIFAGSGAIGDANLTYDGLRIGGRENNPPGKFFDGQIADARVWNLARSGAEIAANYRATLTGNETGLVALWRFEELGGSTAVDSTTNSNPGTLGAGVAGQMPARIGYVTAEDVAISSSAPGVMANDFDAEGQVLTAILVTNVSNGTLTFNGDGSFLYRPNTNWNGTDRFSYKINDGLADSDIVTTFLRVVAVDDLPRVDGVESVALAVMENDPSQPLTSTLTISDPEGDDLAFAAVQITGNYANGEDVLSFVDTVKISGSWNPLTGLLTLTGTASVADYQAALRAVTYSNTSERPSIAMRTVTFTVGGYVVRWTAYNDTVGTSAGNVTGFNGSGGGSGIATGLLRNYASGTNTGVTVTMNATNVSAWTPPGTVNSATPAYEVFGGVIDLGQIASYNSSSQNTTYEAVFTGLDPTKTYEFVSTANRGEPTYAGQAASSRWTKFSLLDSDSGVNASSAGVTAVGTNVLKMNTGYNTVAGDVIRWTGISAADGSFTVRSENVGGDGPGEAYKAYGMQAFMLRETSMV